MIKGGDGKRWERKGKTGGQMECTARAVIYLELVRIGRTRPALARRLRQGGGEGQGGPSWKTRYIRYVLCFPKKVAKKAATNSLHIAGSPLHFLGELMANTRVHLQTRALDLPLLMSRRA